MNVEALLASPHLRPMAGMLVRLVDGQTLRVNDDEARFGAWPWALVVPVFDDPATLGCLLALVREAWGDLDIEIIVGGGFAMVGARWVVDGESEQLEFDSLGEALVAALLAAPLPESK